MSTPSSLMSMISVLLAAEKPRSARNSRYPLPSAGWKAAVSRPATIVAARSSSSSGSSAGSMATTPPSAASPSSCDASSETCCWVKFAMVRSSLVFAETARTVARAPAPSSPATVEMTTFARPAR